MQGTHKGCPYTAPIGADRDAIGVFPAGRPNDLFDPAIVARMDHLGTLRHQRAADEVDGGVVAIEEAGRRDEARGRRELGRPRDALSCDCGHGNRAPFR
jgi:hypothetical protein